MLAWRCASAQRMRTLCAVANSGYGWQLVAWERACETLHTGGMANYGGQTGRQTTTQQLKVHCATMSHLRCGAKAPACPFA